MQLPLRAQTFERFLADFPSKRLQISKPNRPRQGVHLGAGVINVVFPGDGVARLLQQPGQGIANHGAAAVAHVQGSGGIGGNVFHVHRSTHAEV